MPIYEYKCRKCDKVFEEFQSIHDKPLKYCSVCKGRLQKLFSTIGISFKGSGFYVTDSRKSASSPKSVPSGKSNKPSKPASLAVKPSVKE